MEDARIWEMEAKLWHGGAEVYETLIDDDVVMALPAEPFVYSREAAIRAVTNTPRWDNVRFSEQQVVRPQEGLIAIAYRAEASRDDERYVAYCTTTMRRVEHEVWRVVQHSQTVPPVASLEESRA
jgi:hypothetical protein